MRPNEPVLLIAVALFAAAGCSTHPTASQPRSTAASSASATSSTSTHTPPAQSPTTSTASARLIDHVRWTTTANGRQLQVFPTKAGRTDASATGGHRAWGEVLADAPNANTAGMYDQFLCHWQFARIAQPDKPTWNLEPWRPAVGYQDTVLARCNPGGAEE